MPRSMTTINRPKNENRELLFSVTAKDLTVETFMVSGAGGQHRDRTYAGVRITHHDSGVTAQAVDSRSQMKNRQDALRKLTQDPKFQYWVALESRRREGHQTPERYAEQEVTTPAHLRVETKVRGRWVEQAEGAELSS